VRAVGRAVGSLALERGRDTLVVGRDGRLSGPELSAALAEGIRATGANVVDVGMVATPMTYFAAHHLDTQCSVMVTGSHNPPDYNGLKMVVAGDTLSGDDIQALKKRIESGAVRAGAGTYRAHDIGTAYLDRIVNDVHLARPMRIAVDCGNGVAGAFAPLLFRRLGCEVTEMFCEVDGTFPNHHPDPSRPENLADLIARVRADRLELGFAFDGDGDRLGVVTKDGHIIYADRQLMLFAADVLERVPGATVIYDVKSTRNLKPWIARSGRPLMWKTGHSLIKGKMKEVGAALAAMSSHTFFKGVGTASTTLFMRARACSSSCRGMATVLSARRFRMPYRPRSSRSRARKASTTRSSRHSLQRAVPRRNHCASTACA
jgi:phosphomannomutase/phosphoglucomutase